LTASACVADICRDVSTPEYVLGSDDAEIARLQVQAQIIAEPTALLFERGGVRAGMRVLDLGSGPGDVAFQVAQIVGPDGHVVGLEQDSAQIAVAERRRDELGLDNVVFRPGDDAIVPRAGSPTRNWTSTRSSSDFVRRSARPTRCGPCRPWSAAGAGGPRLNFGPVPAAM
jgi:SAM-dependent methyltransferase